MKVSPCILATVVLAPTLAFADDLSSTAPVRDRSRFGLSVGVFTPTGELGAEYTWVANPNLELGLGAGVGGGWQPQVAIMPRLRLATKHTSYSLGAGVSTGRYTTYGGDFGWEYARRTLVLWANVELGIQRTWADEAMFARVAGGVGLAMAHGTTTGDGDMMFSDHVVPYFGITVGHTL